MRIEGKLVEGRFLTRDNRFRVTVEMGGNEVWAHLPNSGRLGELLVPGRRAILVERPASGRKTGYYLGHAVIRRMETGMGLHEIALLDDIESRMRSALEAIAAADG